MFRRKIKEPVFSLAHSPKKIFQGATLFGVLLSLNAYCAVNDITVKSATDYGNPFVAGTDFSLESYGYQVDEFFYSGVANSYTNASPLTQDGKWTVNPTDSAEYTSRMIIYRPQSQEDFNGTVLVEWLNVTGGVDTAADWILLHTEILRSGFVWVGISAQHVGIELGGETPLPPPLGFTIPLKFVNSIRYWDLNHPGDSFSYDIFSQAGQAIRGPRLGLDPLVGLDVKKIIAMGESQSAQRMVTFVNAFGKEAHWFDGFFVHSRFGSVPGLVGGSASLSQPPQEDIIMPDIVRFRDDIAKPILNIQTETDVLPAFSYFSRQPDSDTFRLWEIAGTAHVDYYTTNLAATDEGRIESASVYEEEASFPFSDCEGGPINSAPQHHFVGKAALRALNHWVNTGEAPPKANRLEVNDSGDGFLYDSFGNVRGGIRSPWVDVPIAKLTGSNGLELGSVCALFGTTEFFEDTLLNELYLDNLTYVASVKEATSKAVVDGYILPEDASLIIGAAEEVSIP